MSTHSADYVAGCACRDEPLSLPVIHLRAAIAMLWPEEITPAGKRLLEKICDEYEERARSGEWRA